MDKVPMHILHVDDNALDRELVRDALESESDQFVVTAAASRQEFESQLPGKAYDVVLTDFNILGFEGLQVIDAVHQQNQSVPVILVTGTGSEEIAVEAMKRGASDYVIKTPKHIRRLPLAILAALERKRLQDERLRSEQALQASEARLRAFAKALPDLALIVDQKGNFLDLLSATDHHLYEEGQRLLGRRVRESFPTHVSQPILDAITLTLKTGATQSVEYQLDAPGGAMWFEARISPMPTLYNEQSLVVYIVRDITDRKTVETRLLQERNLLRTLIDNVPDYIYVIDDHGHFITSNTAHAAAVKLMPPQIIGKSLGDIASPDFIQQFHYDDESLMTSDDALINEERLIENADGYAQWVLMTKVPLHNEKGEVIGLVGISRDITDRKKADEALRASEAHLRAVVSGTPVILFELDPNGVLTFLQGQGVSVFEGEPKIFVGTSIFESLEAFIPDIGERFSQALSGEETTSVLNLGDVILDIRYSPLRDKQGEVSGIIGVATDITERLNAEKMRIELEKEQEIIALKERFIATASHDFRTPLTIIKMTVHMLEIYLDQMAPEQRTAKLQQIGKQVDRMVQLLGDVLTMSKANAGKIDFRPERIMLRPFCEQIWESFQGLADKTHRIEFAYEADCDEAELDPNLVHYILVNLLSNAIKYSPQDSHIYFKVSNDQVNLIFQVTDNGIGIPEADQLKLFQPFHRAANTLGIEGTGLGLSIVKSYVEIHGGTISVESKEGKGTSVTVYIPSKI